MAELTVDPAVWKPTWAMEERYDCAWRRDAVKQEWLFDLRHEHELQDADDDFFDAAARMRGGPLAMLEDYDEVLEYLVERFCDDDCPASTESGGSDGGDVSEPPSVEDGSESDGSVPDRFPSEEERLLE